MKKFFQNRYNIIYMVIAFLLILLAFRMAVLTIVEGESYREVADIKKIKDIPVKAPRGKIFDRNGMLLADNKTSFTVQMYTDEIDQDDFNNVSRTLSRILDENGEKPIDDFPIVLDTFEYTNENTAGRAGGISQGPQDDAGSADGAISTYKSADETVVEAVKSNISEWLEYKSEIYGEMFSPKVSVMNALKKYISGIPMDLVDGQFVFTEVKDGTSHEVNGENTEIPATTSQGVNNGEITQQETDPIKIWLAANEIKSSQPAQVAAELLLKENKAMNSLFSSSKIRRLSYEFLRSKGLIGDIRLVEFSFLQDNQFKNIKSELNSKYEEITLDSSAKDDFVFLTMKYSVDNLLRTIYEDGANKIMPGGMLCDRLKEIYADLPVRFNEEGEFGSFEYTDKDVKDRYLNQLHLDKSTAAYDFVKELAVKNYEILYNVITDDQVKYYSQLELLKYENPNISISAWEYTPIRNKNAWISDNLKLKKDVKENYSAQEVFKMLRETLKIDESINDYELRGMLVIRERYKKTSYLSYHPVDVCYGISEKSVAMISERSHELRGINVEIEPIRYYPEYSSAAHALGYLGKISQDYEINKYIVESGYSPDDIIGKTGVEEKFEEYLRGEKGKKTVEVNNLGRAIKSISSKDPIPGDDLYLTLDIKLQKAAEAALEKGLKLIQTGGVYESKWGNFTFKDPYKNATSGALVALDVKTGEVLAMVNYPSYDLNLFSTGISNEDWNSLMNDSKDPLAPKPLYNISLLTAIQPGSTFKMVTALAALEKGVNPNTKVYCAGTEKVGDRDFRCWIYNMYGGKHGYVNMYEAIEKSCNFYFYTTMLGENLATHEKHTVKVSPEDIIQVADQLGLDSKTGIEIDIPQESYGGVPSIESKKLSIRVYLRLFLEANIEKYLDIGADIDNSMKNEIIEEIASWVDREQTMTRGEVYEGLRVLRLNPDKTNDNGVPLGDIIKYTYLNQAVWNAGDSLNISIGQGSNSYTTIQMANYIATLVNGGYKRNVSIVKELKKYDGSSTDYVPKREGNRIELKDYSNLEILKKGMLYVSQKDSAVPYSNFPVQVGSKTGTAQKEGVNPETGKPYDDFAWYVAFAPYDDPQIAVACVIFQGGSGRYPTPIVRDVIGEYLENSMGTTGEKQE